MKTTNNNKFDLVVLLINISLLILFIISPIIFKKHFHIKVYYFIIPAFSGFILGRKNPRIVNLLFGFLLIVIFLVSYFSYLFA
jgi:hypothetical protein